MISSTVEAIESLARYLTSSGHFSSDRLCVKPSAFMPAPDLRLSVFRVDGLDEARIWELGSITVKHLSGRTLHGRGQLSTGDVKEIGLVVDPDNNPVRHASIVGWPEEKSAQKLKAIRLAESSRLVLHPVD